MVLLDDEDAAALEALERALLAELARRADRMESEVLTRHLDAEGGGGGDLRTALVRDGYGPRVVDTLLRYRGSVHAELFRALGALRVLQGEAAEADGTRARTRDTG